MMKVKIMSIQLLLGKWFDHVSKNQQIPVKTSKIIILQNCYLAKKVANSIIEKMSLTAEAREIFSFLKPKPCRPKLVAFPT
jgi:hypothetical protein